MTRAVAREYTAEELDLLTEAVIVVTWHYPETHFCGIRSKTFPLSKMKEAKEFAEHRKRIDSKDHFCRDKGVAIHEYPS